MVTTAVELCNHSLSLLGESRIESLTQDLERARVCNLLYPQTRDETLALYQWPFAVGRDSLAAVSETNYTQFDYRYALPSDYIRMIDMIDPDSYKVLSGAREIPYIDEDYSWDLAKVGVRYQIEGNRLLSDQNPCIIRYIKRVTNPGLFPELFVSVLIPALAAKIAPRLSQNVQLALQVSQLAQAALGVAKAELNQTALTRPPAQINVVEIN